MLRGGITIDDDREVVESDTVRVTVDTSVSSNGNYQVGMTIGDSAHVVFNDYARLQEALQTAMKEQSS